MKNMLKMNKKGFTLVELLAVIVILALLIVITANTVLPMMNKSKKNAMVVYAERVLNTASASYQADAITGGSGDLDYSIAKLMGEDNYYGCVNVSKATDNSGKYVYKIAIFSDNDKLGYVNSDGTLKSVTVSGKADDIVKDYATSGYKPLAAVDYSKDGDDVASGTHTDVDGNENVSYTKTCKDYFD